MMVVAVVEGEEEGSMAQCGVGGGGGVRLEAESND